ncbi:hypothetical protein D1BOALGB6SA_591 [Olavius sp. associated proteobacterium Delta 1]|nr:hypothetical protein D1BOALGB6SA_591 [Olavius sp. associated proteobacterium Delta 1]
MDKVQTTFRKEIDDWILFLYLIIDMIYRIIWKSCKNPVNPVDPV